MNNFILSDDQQNAIDKFKEFIKSNDIDFCLSGKSGTGKSFCSNLLLDYIDTLGIDYCICAPTNKAKIILEEATDRPAITVHSLLAMSPNIELFKLDYKDLKFKSKDSDCMPINGIIFIDECSMINKEIHKLLIDKCKQFNNKIVFFGDSAQINPVKENSLSKSFNSKWKVELNIIHRQKNNNLLLPIINASREIYNNKFEEIIDENGSLYTFDNVSDFLQKIIPLFKESVKKGDADFSKLCCYTNARVEAYNKTLRKILFEENSKEEYNPKEILTCYESSKQGDFKVVNSSDYIIKKVKKTNITIPEIGIFPGYILTLIGKKDKIGFPFRILSKNISENDFKAIARIIEETRIEAIELKKKNKNASSAKWISYFKMMDSFGSPIDLIYDNRTIKKKTFDYGYAISSHKAQGSGYQSVIVDMKDISICRNPEERRQLQYVAISRTKKDLYILQ